MLNTHHRIVSILLYLTCNWPQTTVYTTVNKGIIFGKGEL